MATRPRDPGQRPTGRSQATPIRSQATPSRSADRSRPSSGTPRTGPPPGRRWRPSPVAVILAIAVAGAIVFGVYALTIRDERQVPMLAAASLVTGLAFGAVAIVGAITAYRSARAGREGRAMGAALLGGVAAMIALGSLALAAILGQIWGGTGTAV